MPKIISLLLLIFFFCLNSYGQKEEKKQNSHTNVKILVKSITDVKEKFDSLLVKNNWLTTSYQINHSYFNFTIDFTDSVKCLLLLKTVKSWGMLVDENTSSNTSKSETYSNYLYIESLKTERDQYERLASNLDSTSVKYLEFWEKIISIDKKIASYELEYKLNNNDKIYTLTVRFYEEEIIGSDYDESWINMPGLEYSYLFTEQPKSGFSSSYMAGYSLKYMFNYRKTYATLGLYKSQGFSSLSDTEVNEIYTFSLGQDFYSRKLGRGKRKFFNLYTSFNLGVLMASSQITKYKSWFANPYIGLEIFKNKHILLDNKVGYFLPFENNRNQRGLLYNVSFNFVF